MTTLYEFLLEIGSQSVR